MSRDPCNWGNKCQLSSLCDNYPPLLKSWVKIDVSCKGFSGYHGYHGYFTVLTGVIEFLGNYPELCKEHEINGIIDARLKII